MSQLTGVRASWVWRGAAVATTVGVLVAVGWAPPSRVQPHGPDNHGPMSLDEARPVLLALASHLPAELGEIDRLDPAAWDAWARRCDREIRERLEAGDEDSVVNLLLYGTTFTDRPRATPEALGLGADEGTVRATMEARLEDLTTAVEVAENDERMQFVREVIERHGLSVSASTRPAVLRYLQSVRSRVLSENQRYVSRLAAAAAARDEGGQRAAYATVYHDRGLSSDTSLRVNFAVEQAMVAMRDRAELTPQAIQRAGVIGPGLDFVDKAQGYDFYPVQTLQPFAVADSLLKLQLAQHPLVTAFDINDRVLKHLEHARLRAGRGEPYQLNLVLEEEGASPLLAQYWREFGRDLAEPVTAGPIPSKLIGVRARAVAVRPDVVSGVTSAPLNIVVERPGAEANFDLLVTTNVLVYYEPFEQALALRNMATMLREGGLLFSNQPVPAPDVAGFRAVATVAVPFEDDARQGSRHQRGDVIYVYRRVHARP